MLLTFLKCPTVCFVNRKELLHGHMFPKPYQHEQFNRIHILFSRGLYTVYNDNVRHQLCSVHREPATFFSTPSLRTSTNFYIVNMAISDIFGSCFNWLLYAADRMLTSRTLINGHSAPILCKVGMYSRAVSQLVSVLSLVLIAFDRYIAVVFPLKEISFGIEQGRVRLTLSLFTWLIALAGSPSKGSQ